VPHVLIGRRACSSGTHRFVVIDVFTDTPLEGNQLAVFTDARDIPEERLQPLAREIGFSETILRASHGSAGPEMPSTVRWAGAG
jgi:hypothetical protein